MGSTVAGDRGNGHEEMQRFFFALTLTLNLTRQTVWVESVILRASRRRLGS
jgi:hypothetical protein